MKGRHLRSFGLSGGDGMHEGVHSKEVGVLAPVACGRTHERGEIVLTKVTNEYELAASLGYGRCLCTRTMCVCACVRVCVLHGATCDA